MAKLMSVRSSRKNKGASGIVMLKLVVKRLLMGRNREGYVPEDVKEGHFAVIAEGGDHHEQKRFVLPISCLTNPNFLRLLEQAAEEYGFDHEGALTIPCRPTELETILAQHCSHHETETLSSTCNKTIVFKTIN
ncbi:hypothetical protein RJT34_28614 [Clitoria ternatea]|uniref:Uncharacterized protein n=1 Tax=Clitoria ternatea TaxID=43366 RepID=A0AAN9F930_CLITE